jgi:5-methylcytosine-specific restriction enzyme A
MATELTTKQWIEILQNENLTKKIDLDIFQTLYAFPNHTAFASEIGKIIGIKGKSPQSPLNLEVWHYAKRISKLYDIDYTKRSERKYKYWDLFFDGKDEGSKFYWILRSNLKEALEQTNLTADETFPEEFSRQTEEKLIEGIKRKITVNAYERNRKAKDQCKEYWGSDCFVCGFDFKKNFGALGEGYIHVHHLTPVSKIGKSYEIDPINDLRPVCPNCHSMIHRLENPLTIDELKEIINNNAPHQSLPSR